LVGNRGFRKYLKVAKSKFEIDEKKIKQDVLTAHFSVNGYRFLLRSEAQGTCGKVFAGPVRNLVSGSPMGV
jgi:hypothetical protein